MNHKTSVSEAAQIACIASRICEQASGSGAAIFAPGREFVSGETANDSSLILSRLRHSCCHSRSRICYQNKSTRAQNRASYAGYSTDCVLFLCFHYNKALYNRSSARPWEGFVTSQYFETERKCPFFDIIITNVYCHHNTVEPSVVVTSLLRPLFVLAKCSDIFIETLLMQPQFKIPNNLILVLSKMH